MQGVLGPSGIKKKRKNWRSRRGDGPVGCEKKQETAPRMVRCLGFYPTVSWVGKEDTDLTGHRQRTVYYSQLGSATQFWGPSAK